MRWWNLIAWIEHIVAGFAGPMRGDDPSHDAIAWDAEQALFLSYMYHPR